MGLSGITKECQRHINKYIGGVSSTKDNLKGVVIESYTQI